MKITEYDEAERAARITAAYPAIRAFAPAAFAQSNFPIRVSKELELVRYADIMNEFDNEAAYYREALYTHEEIELMRAVSAVVRNVSASIGREVAPFMSLFPPITTLRAVMSLAPSSVLEIGPGSGFLGAYLISKGVRYCSIDSTQALYLWQNRLFGALSDKFTEYALEPSLPETFAQCVHVPWWHCATMYTRPPKFDVIVCDAALGEFDPWASAYVISLAAHILEPAGAFLYRHLGEERMSTRDFITSRFERSGFRKNTVAGVVSWSLGSLNPTPIPAGTERACDAMPIDMARIAESYGFLNFCGLRT